MCSSQLLTSLLSLLQARYHLKCLRWLPELRLWTDSSGATPRAAGGWGAYPAGPALIRADWLCDRARAAPSPPHTASIFDRAVTRERRRRARPQIAITPAHY